MELLSAGQPDSESELGASRISKQKPKMTTTAEKFTTTRPNSVLNKCALFPVTHKSLNAWNINTYKISLDTLFKSTVILNDFGLGLIFVNSLLPFA